MFKLVAFLFLASNPSDPIGSITYNQSAFQSKESCVAFLDTDAGRDVASQLQSKLKERSIYVKFACAKTEDNTI